MNDGNAVGKTHEFVQIFGNENDACPAGACCKQTFVNVGRRTDI